MCCVCWLRVAVFLSLWVFVMCVCCVLLRFDLLCGVSCCSVVVDCVVMTSGVCHCMLCVVCLFVPLCFRCLFVLFCVMLLCDVWWCVCSVVVLCARRVFYDVLWCSVVISCVCVVVLCACDL